MIEVLYVATDSYVEYRHEFFSTFKYFAPGREKHITILSNAMEDCDGIVLEDGTQVNVIKMLDLLYPCINLHKSYFIEQLNFDADYIFYFDADTAFKNVPDYDWDEMFRCLDEGQVLISRHPLYSLKPGTKFLDWKREEWIDNFCSENMTEKDPTRQSYIPYDTYTYTISSFFAANKRIMSILNNLIIKMTRIDLTRRTGYHIPPFMDENYFNALTSDFENGTLNDGLFFSIKQYSQLYGMDEQTEYYPTCFIYQKGFPNHKTNRR